MRKLFLTFLACFALSGITYYCFAGISGQDFYINGDKIVSGFVDGKRVFVADGGVSVSIGNNEIFADTAVIWANKRSSWTQTDGDYLVRAYFEGAVDIVSGPKGRTTNINRQLVEQGSSLFVSFIVSGRVYAVADNLEKSADIDKKPVYTRAVSAHQSQRFTVNIPKSAQVPAIKLPVATTKTHQAAAEKDQTLLSKVVPTDISRQQTAPPQPQEQQYKYPVNIAALWKPSPVVERSTIADGTNIVTVQGRFYIWQRLNEAGDIVEFQADNAVVFYSDKELMVGSEQTGRADLLVGGDIDSVYIEGDIIMTEAGRTIRADRLFYDFNKRQALAENADMRRFSEARNIPIYLRAQRLIGLNQQIFAGEGILLTSDEFYLPQLSAQASSIVISDTASLSERQTGGYQAELKDVSLKYYDKTLLKLNSFKSGLIRPELPIKSVRMGSKTESGVFMETRWYLARVLGYQEPDDTESTLNLDYYSKRGFGAGAEFDYQTDNYFGSIDSYIIKDNGEDRLGSAYWLRDVEPESDLRGRLRAVHREYLPQDWQLTFEFSYISDRNFIESFYRDEYYTGKEQETLIHLKRSTDNWAVSWLAKVRINDFEDYLEELPGFEYHRTGQSLWDDNLTYYSNTQLSRMRQRYDNSNVLSPAEDFFTYAYTRHEIDMPLQWGHTKYVPYVAASYVFDDGDGFNRNINRNFEEPDKDLFLGEVGLRASTLFWATDEFRRSQLWGINGIRHYIRPHFELAFYEPSDPTIDMRNMLNLGLSQTWQTRRGSIDEPVTIDWMKLDINTTFVSDSSNEPQNTQPASFVFNNPAIPFFNRRYTADYGLERNTFEADYFWQVSDTFATTSYLNTDMQSGVVQQFNVGISRYHFPNTSYYIGSRYLRRFEARDNAHGYYEKGSHALDTAITYRISPRYTFTFAQEYNFDYKQNVDTELTLIRKYRRLLYAITYRKDQARDSDSIVLSVWPEGVRELAIGKRRYIGLTGAN